MILPLCWLGKNECCRRRLLVRKGSTSVRKCLAMVETTPPPDPAKEEETPEPPTPGGDLFNSLLSCKALSEWSPFGAVVAGLPPRAPSRNGLPLLLIAKDGLDQAPEEEEEPPTPEGDLLTELKSCKAQLVMSGVIRVLLRRVLSRTSEGGGGGVDNTLTTP